MSKNNVAEALKSVLADSYALYLKSQNYHWNVTGPKFIELHQLFELHYTDLALAVDLIAERIRALGEKAPGSLKSYSKVSTIEDGDENASAGQMLADLASDQDKILATLSKALKASQAAEDEVSTDLLIGRMQVHEKNRWMLVSMRG